MATRERETGKKKNPIELQKYLKGVAYPASRNDLLDCARENGADRQTMVTMEKLPDQEFKNPADVMKGYGKVDQ